jgi:hypothetical protein
MVNRRVVLGVAGTIASVVIAAVLVFDDGDDGDDGPTASPPANKLGGAIGDVYRVVPSERESAALAAAALPAGRGSSQPGTDVSKRVSRSGKSRDTSGIQDFMQDGPGRTVNAGPGQSSDGGRGDNGDEPSSEPTGGSPMEPAAGVAGEVAVASAIDAGDAIAGGVATQVGAATTEAGNAVAETLNGAGDTVEGIAQSGQTAAVDAQNTATAAVQGIGSGLP